jgi:predicted membrane-bound mannosyltransferase
LQIAGFRPFGQGPWRTEVIILCLAAIGLVFAWLPARYHRLPGASLTAVRWIGCYALLLTAAYSAIPYKTPWCMLGFLQAMILLAGIGAVALVRLVPARTWQALTTLVLLAATVQLAWQSYRANYLLPVDPGNPYAYAHTQTDIRRLADDVQQLARAAPERQAVLVKVVWDNNYYWPLPWYLRGFERVEFWNHVPDDPAAPIVIAAPKHDAALTAELDETHLMTGYYGLRPGVLAQLWVRVDLWEAHLRRLGRL